MMKKMFCKRKNGKKESNFRAAMRGQTPKGTRNLKDGRWAGAPCFNAEPFGLSVGRPLTCFPFYPLLLQNGGCSFLRFKRRPDSSTPCERSVATWDAT